MFVYAHCAEDEAEDRRNLVDLASEARFFLS